ncbi:PGPGW domain-containing protein [Luteithermobacter gelatinilyticus]|uniref:PGPGW domain-containing protein n=1 Tax=Luteithermobacter gelatinilyticus TaxID=2582913 RepID=UPI00143CCFD4|nr:PGPGW domain-containing protein [Luteithermobacter gelatinilyticus]
MIKKPLKLLIGWILFIIGLIIAPLPMPIGQIIALVGLSVLVSESETVRIGVQKLRRKLPGLCRQLKRVRPHMPRFLKNLIDTTDPLHLGE